MSDLSMATRCSLNPCSKNIKEISQDFKVPELFVIEQSAITIDETENFEHGAYAKVLRVSYHGAYCRAKRMHTILTEVQGEARLDLSRFVQECRIASTLRHPNVVQYYGMCMDGPIPMLVMEELVCSLYDFLMAPQDYVQSEDMFEQEVSTSKTPHTEIQGQSGATVEEHIEEGNGAEKEVIRADSDSDPSPIPKATQRKQIAYTIKIKLALDISQGLSYLHNKRPYPIVHRDLSSRNVLMTVNLRAKLVDFGQAKGIKKENAWSSMTPGTLQYLAPELLQNDAEEGSSNPVRNESQPELELDVALGQLSQEHFTNETTVSAHSQDSNKDLVKPSKDLPLLKTAMDMYSYGVLAIEIATQVCPTASTHVDHQQDLNDMEEQSKDRVLYEVACLVLKYHTEQRASAKVIIERLSQVLDESNYGQKTQNQELREDRERTSHGFLIVPDRGPSQTTRDPSTRRSGLKAWLSHKFVSWTNPTPERQREIARNLMSV